MTMSFVAEIMLMVVAVCNLMRMCRSIMRKIVAKNKVYRLDIQNASKYAARVLRLRK